MLAKVYGSDGQSNDLAAVALGPPPEAWLNGAMPNVFIWNTTTVQWEHLQYGVNNMGYSIALNAYGAELNLGYLANQAFGVNIYIIKYAVSGTALGREQGTDQNWGKNKGVLYTNMVSIYNQALAAIPEPYTVEGIYWNQGERDANASAAVNDGGSIDTTLAKYYAVNLAQFVSNLRADINGFSNAKFVFSRVDTPSIFSWFVANQQVYAQTIISRSAWIDQNGLAKNADNIHYTGPSQTILGQRAFDAFNGIV